MEICEKTTEFVFRKNIRIFRSSFEDLAELVQYPTSSPPLPTLYLEKIITKAINKQSDDVIYRVSIKDEIVNIVFIWKGIIDGTCTIPISPEMMIFDIDISIDHPERNCMQMITELYEEIVLLKKKEPKVIILEEKDMTYDFFLMPKNKIMKIIENNEHGGNVYNNLSKTYKSNHIIQRLHCIKQGNEEYYKALVNILSDVQNKASTRGNNIHNMLGQTYTDDDKIMEQILYAFGLYKKKNVNDKYQYTPLSLIYFNGYIDKIKISQLSNKILINGVIYLTNHIRNAQDVIFNIGDIDVEGNWRSEMHTFPVRIIITPRSHTYISESMILCGYRIYLEERKLLIIIEGLVMTTGYNLIMANNINQIIDEDITKDSYGQITSNPHEVYPIITDNVSYIWFDLNDIELMKI